LTKEETLVIIRAGTDAHQPQEDGMTYRLARIYYTALAVLVFPFIIALLWSDGGPASLRRR